MSSRPGPACGLYLSARVAGAVRHIDEFPGSLSPCHGPRATRAKRISTCGLSRGTLLANGIRFVPILIRVGLFFPDLHRSGRPGSGDLGHVQTGR